MTEEIVPHIVSFIMTDDEIRERLHMKDNEIIDSTMSIYSSIDEEDSSLYWTVETHVKEV